MVKKGRQSGREPERGSSWMVNGAYTKGTFRGGLWGGMKKGREGQILERGHNALLGKRGEKRALEEGYFENYGKVVRGNRKEDGQGLKNE